MIVFYSRPRRISAAGLFYKKCSVCFFRRRSKLKPQRTVRRLAALFWQFLFYSFCGFLLEVAFARLTHSPKPDRKCHLLLPVCPVYGVGALGILLLPSWVKGSPILLFLGGALVCTAAEWGLSWFYEKAAGVAFWNYRRLPWNLGGRVCLLFSGFWGLLSLPLVYAVQPWLGAWAAGVPAAVTIPAALFYLVDAATSLFLLRRGGTGALRWYARPGGRKGRAAS